MLFGGKRPLLCGGYALLSLHELCHIYVLFWSGFDADFYADIEDFVQIFCRFLHEKMLVGTSGEEGGNHLKVLQHNAEVSSKVGTEHHPSTNLQLQFRF